MTSPLAIPLLPQLQKIKSLGISYGIMWDVCYNRASNIRTLSLTNIPRTKKKKKNQKCLGNEKITILCHVGWQPPADWNGQKTSSALPRLSTHYWWPANETMTAQTSCGVASARGCQHPRQFSHNKKKKKFQNCLVPFSSRNSFSVSFLSNTASLFIKL